jgi:hypothetical protein
VKPGKWVTLKWVLHDAELEQFGPDVDVTAEITIATMIKVRRKPQEFQDTDTLQISLDPEIPPRGLRVSKLRANAIAAEEHHLSIDPSHDIRLKNKDWHISAKFKDVHAPIYFVVDGMTGDIKYRNLNTHARKVPKQYLD